MEITESIDKGVVEPSYKNPPKNMPTVLAIAGIRKENFPRLRPTQLQERALEIAENDM